MNDDSYHFNSRQNDADSSAHNLVLRKSHTRSRPLLRILRYLQQTTTLSVTPKKFSAYFYASMLYCALSHYINHDAVRLAIATLINMKIISLCDESKTTIALV